MSTKAHKRADTYEGPQMNFKFPSDEDLILQNITKEDKVELTGPKVAPYAKSVASKKGQQNITYYSVPQEPSDSNHLQGKDHRYQESDFSSAYNSNPSTNHASVTTVSIPTQDNISYQITDRVPSRSLSRAPSKALSRSNTSKVNLSRAQSKGNSSLYRKASLKRSKAVKYKVGWLSRLKQMGINIKNKLRKWRIISSKKAFNTTGRRFTIKKRSLKKKNISMPLERGRAKSISELKREINDWYVPQKPQLVPSNSFNSPPAPENRVVSTGTTSTFKRVPPPLPPHRVSLSPMLRAQHEQQSAQSTQSTQSSSHLSLHQQIMNRSFSTPSGVNYNQSQPKVQPTLLQPQSTLYHPYQDLASTEEITNPHMSSKILIDEEDMESQFDENYYATQEEEDRVRELWRGYLRRAVAARIESKLDIYKIAQIPEPAEQQEYADEVFGIISDYDSEETISDFDDADDESLTSVSGSEFSSIDDSSSENISESMSESMSEASTNYYSTYSRSAAASPPIPLSRESYTFIQAQLQNVKRSSTLPIATDRLAAYQNMANPTHNRFQSVLT